MIGPQSGEPGPQHADILAALFARGQYAEVATAAQAIIEQYPLYGFGWKILSMALANLGRHADALFAVGRAVALCPGDADLHYNLGNIQKSNGLLEEAAKSYQRALLFRPDFAEAHNNLGLTLHKIGRDFEAEESYRRALEIKPAYSKANNNLGLTLCALGRFGDAEVCFRRALEANPAYAEALSNLGFTLRGTDRLAEAEDCHRRALAIKPDLVQAQQNLGNVLQDLGRFQEAAICYRRAIALKPDFAWAHSNLGTTLLSLGLFEEAEASHRRAIALRPDNLEMHDNLLLSLNYYPTRTIEAVMADYQAYEDRVALRSANHRVFHDTDPEPNRRLKVGYVSSDLRQHSVAHFVEPLLREHDHEVIDVFCYAGVVRPDPVTKRIRDLASHWISSVGLSDAALAQRIASDKIDILVDLAGHTANNRLPIFALRPAPIQITWLGYPNTTGLRAVDYRFVDSVTDPSGEADRLSRETLIRLENGFLCYAPTSEAPQICEPPCLAHDAVTFGSFNNVAKLSTATLDAWATLLARVPRSRLLAKGLGFTEEACKTAFLARMSQRGVDPSRVSLSGFVHGLEHHLSIYNQVDVALDPFPYNGTTTTCEALWMGVPVVTLSGDRHAGRVGASLLTHVGLGELVGASVAHYIDIAVALAGDPAVLVACGKQCAIASSRHRCVTQKVSLESSKPRIAGYGGGIALTEAIPVDLIDPISQHRL